MPNPMALRQSLSRLSRAVADLDSDLAFGIFAPSALAHLDSACTEAQRRSKFLALAMEVRA